jgi:hypothetical protein
MARRIAGCVASAQRFASVGRGTGTLVQAMRVWLVQVSRVTRLGVPGFRAIRPRYLSCQFVDVSRRPRYV